MNLILEKSSFVDYYTYLDKVFANIIEFQELYWLLSDIECNGFYDILSEQKFIFMDGKSLNNILQNNDIQFIWGVFSAFDKKPNKLPDTLPYADGNEKLWKENPHTQIPNAKYEIICFDSALTLFINISEDIANKLKKLYPDIKNLDKKTKTH